MICAIMKSESEPPHNLAAAYQARNQQLREAHLTLAEAVSALTADLTDRRDEVRTLRNDVASLRGQLENLEKHHAALEAELRLAQNMKVVRWTAPLRRVVYRWRDQRG
jgi:chromosome segregation ATPase